MDVIGQRVERPRPGYPLAQQLDRDDDVTSDDAVSSKGVLVGDALGSEGERDQFGAIVILVVGHPGSQLMSCRTDRAIPNTARAPAQATKVIAPAPGESR